MDNQKLVDYINNQLSKRKSREEIENTLMTTGGWSKSEIDEVFAGIVPVKAEEIPRQYPPILPSTQVEKSPMDNSSTKQDSCRIALKSSIELFNESLEIFRNNFLSFLYALVPAIVVFIFSNLVSQADENTQPLLFLLLILFCVIVSPLSTSSILYVVVNRGKTLTFLEIMNGGFGKILSVVWITLISFFIVSGGSIFFIIPGLIFSVWFSLSLAVLFVEDKRGMDALLLSKEYVKGNWGAIAWRLFVFGILMAFASMIVLIPVSITVGLLGLNTGYASGLISLFLMPFTFIYSYLLYENLKKIKSGAVLQIGNKGPFIAVAVIGCLLIPVIIFGILAASLFSIFDVADFKVDTSSLLNIDSNDNAFNVGTTTESPIKVNVNGAIDTSDWKKYDNLDFGFSISYPADWFIVNNINNSSTGYGNISFGKVKGGPNYDGGLFVLVYDETKNNSGLLSVLNIGNQFADKIVKEENLILDGVSAVKKIITTPSVPSWYYESVVFSSGNMTYIIENGAVQKDNFEKFYKSFKFSETND